MGRPGSYPAPRTPDDRAGYLRSRTKQLLFQLPVCIAIVLSFTLMVSRFVLVLQDNFHSGPGNWWGLLALAAIMGCASFLVVLACGAVGAAIGFALQLLFARRPARFFTAHR